jgi:hypothetical protein
MTADMGTRETYGLAHHLTVDGDKRGLMIAALRYYDTFVKRDGTTWRDYARSARLLSVAGFRSN